MIQWIVDPLQSFNHGQALRGICEEMAAGRVVVEPSAKVDLAWERLVFTSICHSTNWYALEGRIRLPT